jgi:hypothetical protein
MTPYYGPSKFSYDAEHDRYLCPQGQPLLPSRIEEKAQKVEYSADATTCNACPVKALCTSSDHGRQVHRSFFADFLERVKGYHQTSAYHKAMNKRKVWVEPLFAEAKDWHGLRRFRLRRLQRVTCEALVTATGQNLKRLLQKRGWGRRPFPAQAVATVPPPNRETENPFRDATGNTHRRKVSVAWMTAFGPTRTCFGAQISIFSQVIFFNIIFNISSFIYSLLVSYPFYFFFALEQILCIFKLMYSLVSSTKSFSTGCNVNV